VAGAWKFIHSLVFSPYAGLAGTRAQSGDRYGSGTLHPGQVLRGRLPLLSPAFRRSHIHRRCLHIHNNARDPSSERWNCGREMLSGNFAKMTTSTPFRDLLHAANLRRGNTVMKNTGVDQLHRASR
jgi:hypothetical protein